MTRRLVFGHTHLVSPVWKIYMSIDISCSVNLYFLQVLREWVLPHLLLLRSHSLQFLKT